RRPAQCRWHARVSQCGGDGAVQGACLVDGRRQHEPRAGRDKPNFQLVRKIFGTIKPTQYEDGKELTPGISAMGTYGHTMGHTSHILSSGDKSVLVQADVTNYPAIFARNPGWHFLFDMDGPMAEATRRRVYDRLAADKMMVQG